MNCSADKFVMSIAAAILLSGISGCTESQPEVPGGGDGLRIEVGGLPDSAGDWDCIIYSFVNGGCVDVARGGILSGIEMEASDGVSVALACEDMDRLVLGAIIPGLPLSSYFFYLKDKESPVPEIWHWEGTSAALSSGITLKKYPPVFKMKTVSEPEDFNSLTATVEGLATRVQIEDGFMSLNTNAATFSRTFTLKAGESQLSENIMPMVSDGAWTLQVTLKMEGREDVSVNIPVTESISAGCEIALEVDFADYAKKGTALFKVVKSEPGKSPVTWKKSVTLKDVLPENKFYEVSVAQADGSWKKVDVYDALVSNAPKYHGQIWNDWNNSKKLRDTSSFTNFTADFSAPVKVRIKNLRPFSTVEVRPSVYGIEPVNVGDNTVELTIPSYEQRKLSVEFDGDRFHNLMLLPNSPDPERPDPANLPSNMKYYGPGVWNPEWITLREGETLYIDEGAVVFAKVDVVGDGTAIKGRGLLSGARLAHTGNIYASGYQLIESNASKLTTRYGFTATGITVVDSPSWTFSIYRTDNVVIDNVNIICWILNGDGIDFCSVNNGVIKDCFIRSYDDCITLKVNHLSYDDTQNIEITDNLIWADYAGGIVVGPESGCLTGGRIHDVNIKDCIVLDYPTLNSNYSSDDRGGLCISQYPSGGDTSGNISDILFSNITIDNIRPNGRPISVWQKPSQGVCTMERVTFSDIRILSASGCGKSTVVSNGNIIKSLKFNNVTYNSAPIQDSGKWLVSGDNIEISY